MAKFKKTRSKNVEALAGMNFADDEFLNFILNSSQLGFWKWNVVNDQLFFSNTLKSVLGINRQSDGHVIQNLWNCIHPADLSDFKKEMVSCHVHERIIDTEVRIQGAEQKDWVWVRVQCRMIFDNDLATNVLAGSFIDISEAVELRQKLEQRNADLRFIFDNVPAKIWYKDDKNKIIRLNEKAAASMGISVDEGEGADTYELFPEVARKYHNDDLKVIESGEALRDLVEEYIPLNGPRGWVRTDKIPFLDPVTHEKTILVVSIDITEQKATEEQLKQKEQALAQAVISFQESNERFDLATKGSSVGIWEWPIQDQTEVYWSPIYYNLLGYEDREIVASYEAFQDSVHQDDKERFFEELDRCLEFQKKLRIETRIKQKNGGYKWFLICGEGQWDEDGTPLRMIGSAMDIHDLKAAQLKAEVTSLKLEVANTELENFAYVASHDLKAPLRSMDNLAVWIEEDLGASLTEDISSKLALLRGRILRLDDMLKDILAFSYAGKQLSKPEELDMENLIDEVVKWIDPPPNFVIKKVSNFPKVTMIKTMMEQIFLNLLSNAVKHNLRDNGIVNIAYISHATHHEFVIIDNGQGIAEKYHSYVFELFKTLRPRDKVAGSGLGLSIVKKMLGVVGGEIWIEDPKDHSGAEFHFTIPNKIVSPVLRLSP